MALPNWEVSWKWHIEDRFLRMNKLDVKVISEAADIKA
jgi:hypothetical protein